ncbi:VWA domain-containing protein [Pseudidiomarina sp.]|uniref:VWA domain-containing protein n=1 Tax=Pseudidiomarina sp. TaxID=2081707 RepID=UPI00299DDB38|nr:VWA domain-containing protein [Pseudidiomarina sp.]MDX1705030.1 VWA domain-containing protein [Pseudidiomarina sp.]
MADFHFIRPWWLLALVLVAALTWLLWRRHGRHGGWHDVLPAHLAALLVDQDHPQSFSLTRWLAPLALTLSVLALAGPTWERLPQPVYQLDNGQVVILDMSMSMRSTDIEPDRLTQMRYKAMDLVTRYLDGETGLIAYAGDAFVISPLSGDGANLSNLIRALSPEIMPEQGSYPLRALTLANRLLVDSGYPQGDIYWLTDGIDSRDQQELSTFLRQHDHRVSILAIGTQAGAPIKLTDGTLLRDASGQVVIPQLYPRRLESLAQITNGRFAMIRNDLQDLSYLTDLPPRERRGKDADQQGGDQWLDRGPWLLALVILLLLPMARRGMLPLVLIGLFGTQVPPAYSQEQMQQGLAWDQQLWQTPYQQADQALENKNYDRAAAIAEDPWQRGTANYRAGNYEAALTDFSQMASAEGFYNQGNALMQLQRYDEAAQAYNEALERRPGWSRAAENLQLAEQLAEQQQQQQQQQQGESQSGESEQQDDGEQQSDSQNQSDSPPAEQPPDAAQQQDEQNEDAQEGNDSEEQSDEQQQEAAAEAEAEKQADDQQATTATRNLTDEERQQLEQWLNRIEDDPAVLLRNKMQLEAQKRRQQRPPRGVEKQW